MKAAATITVCSCRRGHLHILMADEAGNITGHAALSQREWNLFVKNGNTALAAGEAPVAFTFELEMPTCPIAR